MNGLHILSFLIIWFFLSIPFAIIIGKSIKSGEFQEECPGCNGHVICDCASN